jgi:MFS family permease
MSTQTSAVTEPQESWVPMITIALGQMIMSFNVASLPVALGGMVNSFGVPPTTIATGIVAYSMLVAGFVMLGAKLIQRYGATRVFRAAIVVFCASQVLMTFSPTANMMIAAQALCGAAGAVIVPSLVALIAQNYKGRQQATAVGALGSARAAARPGRQQHQGPIGREISFAAARHGPVRLAAGSLKPTALRNQ